MQLHAPLLVAALLCIPPATAQEPTFSAGYVRQTATPNALSLEVAIKTFLARREEGPATVVSLVGAVHLGERSYYGALQSLLDDHDLVLYEQVTDRPRNAGLDTLHPAERARVEATERRLELLVAAATRFRQDTGRIPATTGDLVTAAQDPLAAARIALALSDAWGRWIELAPGSEAPDGDEPFRARSLGSDLAPGGEGSAADLEVRAPEVGPFEPAGLQKNMADALGLAFQLEAINYLGDRWRNCDVSVSELRALFEEQGSDASPLLEALSGGSLFEGAASRMLKLLGSTEGGRSAMKLVGIETLARADELMAAMPLGLEGWLEVLIDRRNDVVLEELAAVLEEEPELARVAVFYGAGHMADLEQRLVTGLELVPLEEVWLPAVVLEYEGAGLSRSHIDTLRRALRATLDYELKMLQR